MLERQLGPFSLTAVEEIVQKIIEIPPPHQLTGLDKVRWMPTSNGIFLIKTAYQTITESTWNNWDKRWKKIWTYPGPQRIRFFLWLACKQRLLTNLERL
ncbi:nitrogen regulatory protein P-II-like protein [Gossypium australe]|uniref:Nitrogen regulatory protein P-II-like protein n=1 Tax=Gossypium australe TaxID=47621 RepID=A0A5B6WWM4_9ROSI|nr:nitrogen regulatory protein P-II-like protein [Gossypium australe]